MKLYVLGGILGVACLLFFGGIAAPAKTKYAYYHTTIEIAVKRSVPSHLRQDHFLLSRLIYSEALNQSLTGKRCIGDVVIHLTKFKGWSIKRVIFDRNKYGPRFDGIDSKHFHNIPDETYKKIYRDMWEESMEAARLAILGYHILPYGVFYYHNPDQSTDSKWTSYIEQFPYKKIEDHLFCWHPDFFKA